MQLQPNDHVVVVDPASHFCGMTGRVVSIIAGNLVDIDFSKATPPFPIHVTFAMTKVRKVRLSPIKLIKEFLS